MTLQEKLDAAGISIAKKQRHNFRAVVVADGRTMGDVLNALHEVAGDIANGVSSSAGGGPDGSLWMGFGKMANDGN